MVRRIKLDPNWDNTAAWFGDGLATHSFDYGAREPVVSFIEQIVYLAMKDHEAGKIYAEDGRINQLKKRILGK